MAAIIVMAVLYFEKHS
ncbi:hypothetical protein FNJ44_RS06225 [Escherichia coli]